MLVFPLGTNQVMAQDSVLTPRIVASVAGDWFWTADFTAGELYFSIYDIEPPESTAPIASGSKLTDESGFVVFEFGDHMTDLLPGYYLVVSDGDTTKTLMLELITMEVFDTGQDYMEGYAPPGRDVYVSVGISDIQFGFSVIADSDSGAWSADFGIDGFDITEDMRPWSFAQVFDDDGDANEANPPAPPPTPWPTWRDDFESETLNETWVLQNGAPGDLSLVDGFLRISASDSSTPLGNLLLRPVADGDFVIKTHLNFEPDTNFQFAGLVIYQDTDNFLQFGRAYCDVEGFCTGNGIYFDRVSGGISVDSNFGTSVDSPDEAYLRLERRGDMVKAFFSYEGTSWYEIGTHWLPSDFQVNGVGLTASQDFFTPDWEIAADFDFFEVTEGWGFLPEGYHDYDQGDVPNWACNAGGWAVDPDDRSASIQVEIVVDHQTVAQITASEYRQDLLDTGQCTEGNCGFFTAMWRAISSYEPHSVVVWAQDIPSGEWVRLSSSPKTLTCRSYDIYIYDTETGLTSQLTNLGDSNVWNPRWSPDGKKIVHDRWTVDWENLGVHITDVKTGVSVPLTGAEGGNYPTWSPNGKWIAFNIDNSLYVVGSTGGQPKLLREDAFMASWAPDSDRLVFNQPSDGSIRTMDIDGRNVRLVERDGYGPAWSPDGEWIAYEHEGDLWKVRVNMQGVGTGQPIRLTSDAGYEGRPSWSNNGNTIVYHAGVDRWTDIWTISADGGLGTWLTGGESFADYDPNYSFNGRYIAYSSYTPITVPPVQQERLWAAAFTYDVPAGFWTEGIHPYHFELQWSYPEPGFNGEQGGEFEVSYDAPLYDGYVLLRGPFELCRVIEDEYGNFHCEEETVIHPDQPTRFLIGWVFDNPVTYGEAFAQFDSLTGRVVWDEGQSADLTMHEIRPFYWGDDWWSYTCYWTIQN